MLKRHLYLKEWQVEHRKISEEKYEAANDGGAYSKSVYLGDELGVWRLIPGMKTFVA